MSNAYSFSLAKPLNTALVYYNVTNVSGPLHWINDLATTRSILLDLEPDRRDWEFDKKCFAQQNEVFFYDMMNHFRWSLLNRRNGGFYINHFNIGLSFSVEKCQQVADFFLICMTSNTLFRKGAIFKRFKNPQTWVLLWENGECYVIAANETAALWMGGIMNYALQQILLPKDLKTLRDEEKTEGKILLRTKEIKEKKLYQRPTYVNNAACSISTRVQPDRKAKTKKHVGSTSNKQY